VRSLANLLPQAKGTTVSSEGAGYVLKWTSAATSTTPELSNSLTLSSAKLPMLETSTDSSGEKATTSISQWGETVVVQAPAAAGTLAASKIKS